MQIDATLVKQCADYTLLADQEGDVLWGGVGDCVELNALVHAEVETVAGRDKGGAQRVHVQMRRR